MVRISIRENFLTVHINFAYSYLTVAKSFFFQKKQTVKSQQQKSKNTPVPKISKPASRVRTKRIGFFPIYAEFCTPEGEFCGSFATSQSRKENDLGVKGGLS